MLFVTDVKRRRRRERSYSRDESDDRRRSSRGELINELSDVSSVNDC